MSYSLKPFVPRDDRGAAAIITGLSIVLLFGMVALVVDVGELYQTRSELQNAADAAALAAAEHIDNPSQAVAAAQQWANENHSEGGGIIVAPSDVEFGRWDTGAKVFVAGASPPDAVRVTTRRTDARGNPVEHAFAGAIGSPQSDVVARAVAKAKFTIIDFESNFSSGDTPTVLSHGNGISGDPVSGTVTITGHDFTSSQGDGGNDPMIFDGTCNNQPNNCTGNDNDLYQPGQGNILILSEDGDSTDPDDERWGGVIEFDFSNFGDGQVTIGSLVVIDSEADSVVEIKLYRDGALIAIENVAGAGDGKLETRLPTPVPDIDYMIVKMEDSGAIDDIGYSFGVSLVE